MTRSACPTCRLRFSRVTAAHLAACPFCAGPVQDLAPADLLGFRLLALEPLLEDEPPMPQAIALELTHDAPSHRTDPRA
jgi:hypothetical protein